MDLSAFTTGVYSFTSADPLAFAAFSSSVPPESSSKASILCDGTSAITSGTGTPADAKSAAWAA